MKPGPPRQPPELALIKGNVGHRKLARHEAEIPLNSRPPAILKGEARSEWDRIAPLLQHLGLLKAIDREVLVVYCQAVADFRWAVSTLRREGRLALAKNGKRAPHPAHLIQRQAAATIHRVSAEFGMTPAARAGVDITPGSLDDKKYDRFFNKSNAWNPKPRKGKDWA